MDNISPAEGPPTDQSTEGVTTTEHHLSELKRIKSEFEERLALAHLRTDALRAGMIDLDGLKLVDLSSVRLGPDDQLLGSRELLESLRRNKPWLFGASSSSSVAMAPASQAPRQKTALEMTADEYAAARASLTKRRYS